MRSESEKKQHEGKSDGRARKPLPPSPGKVVRNPGRIAASSRKKRVTIADIARRAGVSPTTVSLTLSDRRDISLSETTRERIKRCADELGYFPNRLGEGFFHGRSKLIGILILSDSYHPFLDCIAGIHKSLAEVDFTPLLMTSDWISGCIQDNAPDNQELVNKLPALRRLLEYQVDGVLYFSTDAEHTAACVRELGGRKIPTVILGGVDTAGGTVDIVGGDNERIGRMAAEHLLSVGCASFVFGKPAFAHPLDAVVHSSFAARLKAAGHICKDFTLDVENPGDLGGLLPQLAQPPVGFFCTRDEIAGLTLRAAFNLGWWIPRDFATVVMGQADPSRFHALPMTTINRNSFMAGEMAAKLLVRRIKGFGGKPQNILIPPSFEARASSISDVSWVLQSKPTPSNVSLSRSKRRYSRNKTD
jgi:LacI family transcriptional regulator